MSEIDLETLIKLYCNHRPVFGLPLFKVYDAFSTLAGADGDGRIDRGKTLQVIIRLINSLYHARESRNSAKFIINCMIVKSNKSRSETQHLNVFNLSIRGLIRPRLICNAVSRKA